MITYINKVTKTSICISLIPIIDRKLCCSFLTCWILFSFSQPIFCSCSFFKFCFRIVWLTCANSEGRRQHTENFKYSLALELEMVSHALEPDLGEFCTRYSQQERDSTWPPGSYTLVGEERACMLSHFCCVWHFATPWTATLQVPLSIGFSKLECWRGLPCPPPGVLPDPGIEPKSPASSAL